MHAAATVHKMLKAVAVAKRELGTFLKARGRRVSKCLRQCQGFYRVNLRTK